MKRRNFLQGLLSLAAAPILVKNKSDGGFLVRADVAKKLKPITVEDKIWETSYTSKKCLFEGDLISIDEDGIVKAADPNDMIIGVWTDKGVIRFES